MEHLRAIELLPALASGEVSGEQRAALRAHAEDCEECRRWLETWELLAEALAAGPREGADRHPESDRLARFVVNGEELSQAELEDLTAHLADCETCRRETELTRAALEASRRLEPPRAAWPRRRIGLAAGVVLAVGAALVAGLMWRPAPTGADRRLSDTSLGGRQVIEASGSLTATAVTVERGAEITFRAGDAVILEDGFSVADDASLDIETAVR